MKKGNEGVIGCISRSVSAREASVMDSARAREACQPLRREPTPTRKEEEAQEAGVKKEKELKASVHQTTKVLVKEKYGNTS